MSCNLQAECPGQGVWMPVLILAREGTKIKATMPEILACQFHREMLKLDELVSPEAWDKISKHLRENGKGTFAKRSTKLTWEKSKQEDALPF